MRTLRLVDTHVGWDMFCERVNRAIKTAVTSHINRERIAKFVNELNFTSHVASGLDALGAHTATKPAEKSARTDIDRLKQFFRARVGTTFAACTAPSEANLLDLDLTSWGGRPSRMRRFMPWTKVQRKNNDLDAYVRGQLQKLCHWHTWAP